MRVPLVPGEGRLQSVGGMGFVARGWFPMSPTRLNGMIRALEAREPAFATFAGVTADEAIAVTQSGCNGVIFDLEHHPFDVRALRDSLQYLLNRRQIVESGGLAPAVTPLVRLPANGAEHNQWMAKQALDSGIYGVLWPHISTVEEARSAVAACRYARPAGSPVEDPAGTRGFGPGTAARYWGLPAADYVRRADVWPLAPEGEIFVAIMCEDARGVRNLPRMLETVPGISAVLIGEGDLSQDLGHPMQYEHPIVAAAIDKILAICRQYDIPCGHPHVTAENLGGLIDRGFRWFLMRPKRSYPAVEAWRGRAANSRSSG